MCYFIMNTKGFSNFLLLTLITILLESFDLGACENVKKSINDNRDDNGEANDEPKDESMDVAAENEPPANMTCSRKANSQMHEIRQAAHKQFPFMAAVMSQQNEYLCSGTVVSKGLILTTATCLQGVSYVLLNTTKGKRDDTTVMLHVIKTEKFPTYTPSETVKDVGLIYTEKHNNSITSKIVLSNYTSSTQLSDIEAIGFGLNHETGQVRELQFVGLEIRSPPYYDYNVHSVLTAYFDCVDTKVPTCYKDTGGPVIYANELIGIVASGQEECSKEMSAVYILNKKMAVIIPTFTFKSWLDEKIKKYEEHEESDLPVYPSVPAVVFRQAVKMTSAALKISPSYNVVMIYLLSSLQNLF